MQWSARVLCSAVLLRTKLEATLRGTGMMRRESHRHATRLVCSFESKVRRTKRKRNGAEACSSALMTYVFLPAELTALAATAVLHNEGSIGNKIMNALDDDEYEFFRSSVCPCGQQGAGASQTRTAEQCTPPT